MFGALGFVWAKTADEAIDYLKTGRVERASLDHDLADEHYPWSGIPEGQWKEKTGLTVVRWMVENNVWPRHGVRVHSWNPVGAKRMIQELGEHYVG